jgi:hypothetical protein
MRAVESQLDHGHLVKDTEKFALKGPDRFKEKFADSIARNPDKTPGELAGEVYDSVRYTFICSPGTYCEDMWNVHRLAESRGYELEVRRNSWESEEYKGVNSRWLDPERGQLFEIQFHTEDSWEAKQQTHDAYEKIADPRTPPREVQRLRDFQKDVSSRVEIPPEAPCIPNYRREGR